MADLAQSLDLEFPDFSGKTLTDLSEVLGDGVILANPLDYHTYIWGDVPKMTACFKAVMEAEHNLSVFVLDIPRSDRCDPQSFDCAVQAILKAREETKAQVAVLSLIPENLDEGVIARFADGGVTVLNGMETGLEAIEAAYKCHRVVHGEVPENVWLASVTMRNESVETEEKAGSDTLLSEFGAKHALATYGLDIPSGKLCTHKDEIAKVAQSLNYPLALKTLGLVHKTEAGGVILNIQNQVDLHRAVDTITDIGQGFLIEEMSAPPIAELILGVTREETGLLMLTIGSGGVFTEIIQDSVSILLPSERSELEAAVKRLKISPLLTGYRGRNGVNMEAVYKAVEAVSQYVKAHRDHIVEIDINPLLAGPDRAIAVDAFVRLESE